MVRPFLAVATAALIASPSFAATYSGKPIAPSTQRIIARDIVWNCGPAACQGAPEESRPGVLCQSLAKRPAGSKASWSMARHSVRPSSTGATPRLQMLRPRRWPTPARTPTGAADSLTRPPDHALRACVQAAARPIYQWCFANMNSSRRFAPTIRMPMKA